MAKKEVLSLEDGTRITLREISIARLIGLAGSVGWLFQRIKDDLRVAAQAAADPNPEGEKSKFGIAVIEALTKAVGDDPDEVIKILVATCADEASEDALKDCGLADFLLALEVSMRLNFTPALEKNFARLAESFRTRFNAVEAA